MGPDPGGISHALSPDLLARLLRRTINTCARCFDELAEERGWFAPALELLLALFDQSRHLPITVAVSVSLVSKLSSIASLWKT
jgi:hypothetical protein